MALFEQFPYTNLHELNLDWLLQKMKELAASQHSLEEAMAELEYYIHHLDVDDIVVETLNNMLADGTLGQLMAEAISEYETQISAQVAQQDGKIAVLESRMDEFASLPDGSTAGNAELLDIRVDAWGDTYPSAGDAVRGQVAVLSDSTPDNLIWPTAGGSGSANGLGWTWNGDGSITISGTASATTTFYLNGTTSGSVPNIANGSYVVQRWTVSGSGNLRFSHIENGSAVNLIQSLDDYVAATFTQSSSDGGVYLQVGNGNTVDGTFRFMVSVDNGLPYPAYSPMVQHTAKDAVARTQIADLANKTAKGVKWRYILTSEQDATEALEILMNDAWLVHLVHTVNAGANADVWRISFAWISDANFTQGSQLTARGEWEAAIKLSGWGDFSGGYLHGHEWLTTIANNANPYLIADGVGIAESDFHNHTIAAECKELIFIEHTSMQAPEDTGNTTRANHTRIYRFTENGIIIDQGMRWNTSGTTAACYMAMLPASKVRFSGWADDAAGAGGYRDLSGSTNYSYTHVKAKNAVLCGSYGTFTFDIGRYPEGLTGGDTFLVSDNGGNNYHKCYYVVCDGQAVSTGDIWNTRTIYNYYPAS